MFFKRLEILGFKSFGDRTVFEFEPGITTIVGPNGCGKSNVSDAIRWVLGEQSAKALRGGKMEDVIFNGTDDRAAINMAEVTFTIEDPEKVLPLGYHEISVTRRVFRDGQGEYFINKNPCRLKDIHELFMGTGIGTDAYSILEQGKMDMILNAKPQERRELFEEASGITKFKVKKVEAMRKLEATEENLVRVNDILKEVKRQIQSVQRFAAKARKYRALFDEMKSLQIAFGRHRYEGISAALEKLQSELSVLSAEQKEKQDVVQAAQEELSRLRRQEQALLDEQDAFREETAQWERDLNRKESQFRADEQRLEELAAASGRWETEIREHREKANRLAAELEEARKESSAWEASVEEARRVVSEEDAALRQMQEKIRDITQRQKQYQEQLLEDEMATTRARNESGGLSASHKGVIVKRERLISEQGELQRRAAELEKALEDARRLAQDQDAHTIGVKDGLSACISACEEWQKRIDEALEQSEKLREELARKKTEWNLLQQWKEQGAVWNAGESAEALRRDKRVLEVSADGVRTEGAGKEALQRLLNCLCVLRKQEDAGALRAEHSDAVFVTVQDAGRQEGLVTFALNAGLSMRVYGRDNAIAMLALEIERLQENLHDTIVNKGGFVVELEAQKARRAELEAATRQAEIRQATLRHEWEKIGAQRGQSSANQAVIAKELEEAERELKRFRLEDDQHQTFMTELEARQRDHKASMDALAQELEACVQEREKKLEDVTHRKIQMAALEEKLENRLQQVRDLTERVEELRALAEAKETDSRASHSKIEALKQSVAQWHAVEKELLTERARRREAMSALQAKRQESMAQTQSLEKTLTESRAALAQWAEKQRSLEVERAQHQGQRDNLRENLLRDFQTDLQSPPAALAEGETPFSLDAFGGSWDSVKARVAEIRPLLDGMGSVNVSALQEHDELQTRYDFLIKQHEDLVAAKQTLLKVISRINTTTRKLFAETFAAIRANFQEIYVQLFGGGKADLLLSDETDILEAGIEIVARPPGKKLQNVSLLSGGEKALTAVALLFAVFQVKPSPYCVLDEIDAPLDESNITRFVSMLREYAAKTQFIVITHNKRTIAKADVLYGITMQESGISKVVSVRLTDSPAPAMAETGAAAGPTPMFVHPPEASFARGAVQATVLESVTEEASERSEE